MKRLIPLIVLFSLLCGCSLWGRKTYVSVTPHDEGYQVAVDSSAITVSSYLGLKKAILDFVEEGITDGVIRVESYPGEITEDLEDAVYEIWRSEPLGAYAVDFMTYDCAKIASQYEIHIHNTFRRSIDEINSIIYASNLNVAQLRIQDAMETYEDTLILRVGEYQDFDVQVMVNEIFSANPDFALELPAVTMTCYPESGAQRILEITFDYTTEQETLLEYKTEMNDRIDLISRLYSSNNNESFCARRFYDRVRRDGVLVGNVEKTSLFANSVYGAIIENSATSMGYAQTYCMLLESRGIPCDLIQGIYMGQNHYWCRVVLDEERYYVDPSPIAAQSESFMLLEDELPYYGYEMNS